MGNTPEEIRRRMRDADAKVWAGFKPPVPAETWDELRQPFQDMPFKLERCDWLIVPVKDRLPRRFALVRHIEGDIWEAECKCTEDCSASVEIATGKLLTIPGVTVIRNGKTILGEQAA